MGWGRVDPAPPASINTTRMQKRKGGKKEKNDRQKKGRPRERVRPFLRKKGETEREKHKGF
jgi:hypothetical protein